MSSTTVSLEIADPYAQALMSLAKEQQLEDRFGEDAQAVLDLLGAAQELQQFLENPLMAEDAKKGVLQQISTELHPLFANFLKLLVDKGRIGFVTPILRRYQELLRQLRRTVLAEVTATVELSDAQKDQIRQKVATMTGAQQVDLEVALDSSLLGGVIIKVGSQVVDASLRGQLRRLSMQLSSAA
ncbi:MAG: ATP synthase F1 subunit delta [Cyanobacteria bacterium P01_F01_bin.56]